MIRSNVLGSFTYAWEYGAAVGPTIILVHGFRGDHHGLEGIALQLTSLAPELRVVVPDLPGFGKTPAIPDATHTLDCYGAWLREFTAQITSDPFVILGHSFGSLVVSNATAQGLVAHQTILVNPIAAPALEGPQAVLTQLAIAYYRVGAMLPERPARTLLGHPAVVRVMSEVMAKTREPSLRRWIHEQHHQFFSVFSDTETLSEAFRASVSHTVLEYAGSLTAPTLMIVGDRDDITPLSDQLVLRDRLPDVDLVVMPGVGHLVHYEAVSETAEAIVQFLSRSQHTLESAQ